MSNRLVDAHVHTWRVSEVPAVGVLAAAPLRRDYGWADFDKAAAGLGRVRVLDVDMGEDAPGQRELGAKARQWSHPASAGRIVSCAVDAAGSEQRLARIGELVDVRGVRQSIQSEPDRRLCTRAAFVRGARAVAQHDLTLDIVAMPDQLQSIARLAELAPQTTIVVNHLGKPTPGSPPDHEWSRGIVDIGKSRNVFCKVSVGLYTATDPPISDEWGRQVIRHVVESFGWDRVIFASNWPVSGVVVRYRQWVELVRTALGDGSPGELGRLFSLNAERAYSLQRRLEHCVS